MTSTPEKVDIFDLSPGQLTEWFRRRGEPEYRARQLFQALWQGGIASFSEAAILPVPLRNLLSEIFFLPSPQPPRQIQTAADGTQKALFEFSGPVRVETVAIPKAERLTLCLSTQAGCAMGCRFCATAGLGLKRSLLPGEMIAQVRSWVRLLGRKPTNLVFMGMGEPLMNLAGVRSVLEELTHPHGWNWSAHKSVVSTSGWVPGILEWIQNPLPANLAVSLNAVRDSVRNDLMPVNRKYPLPVLFDALRKFSAALGAAIHLEYVLLRGINDSEGDARLLGRWLKKLPAKVNLIPYNPVPGLPYRPSSPEAVRRFQEELRRSGIPATLRSSRGVSIQAACGQLAAEKPASNAASRGQARRAA